MPGFRPEPDVVGQRLGEEMVLIHLRTNHIYELNRTGARFWELLTAGLDPARIRQSMLSEYGVDEAHLDREISTLLSSLHREQLIAVSS